MFHTELNIPDTLASQLSDLAEVKGVKQEDIIIEAVKRYVSNDAERLQMIEDITIARQQLRAGKGIPHEMVEKNLRARFEK